MKEIFKDIKGYEGLYQVSNLGRVKSLNYRHTGKERILKLEKLNTGYLQVGLSKEGKLKKCKVHRLVASAFIENPNNFKQVNHKNEDKTDNCLRNLEWCDVNYNNNYGTRTRRASESMKGIHINRKDLSRPIKCIENGVVYHSTKEAERQTGVYHSDISKCCNGDRKTAGGFHWQSI